MFTIKVKGNSLTMLRVKKGLSMNEFAREINSNVGVISRIENSTTNPRPKTAKKICVALDAEFDEIFEIFNDETK